MSAHGPLCRIDLEIVGGPYDGAPGLVFVTSIEEDAEDLDELLPERIRLGRCPGDLRCRMSLRCEPGHVAYWIPDLEDPPPGLIEYELEEESVQVSSTGGRARYAIGGVSSRGRELAFAGAGESTRDMEVI